MNTLDCIHQPKFFWFIWLCSSSKLSKFIIKRKGHCLYSEYKKGLTSKRDFYCAKFSVWWTKPKSDNSQFPIILMVVKTSSASCIFLDNGLKSQQGALQFFWNKIKFKGLPLTSKATNGYFGQGVWNWIKKTSQILKKCTRTRTIKISCELPAVAGKFPLVTRRNRRQSVPAETFDCIRRYFYLRISIPAAFGITVYLS